MTVTAETSSITYTGNGATVAFAFPYRFLENAHLRVIRTIISTGAETELVLDSGGADGFTATGAGTPGGGTITVVTAPTALQRLTIDLGNIPATQEQAYVPNTTLPAQTVERALDKLTMLVQSLIGGGITRVLRLIVGDTDGSGRYNANGNRIVDLADGTDPTDAATVQQVTAASSGDFIAAGAGAVTRTMQNKVRESVSVLDFGAAGNNVADDTAAINAALTYAGIAGMGVLLPAGVYKITGTLTVPGGVRLHGEGWSPYTAGGTPNVRGGGSWIHVTHTGTPALLVEKDGSVLSSGATMSDFGMFWDHDDPGVGWAPTVYDWAIKVDRSDDVTVRNVLMLNPYQGIQITGSIAEAAGRLNLENVFGQPFSIGVDIDFSADVSSLHRVHFWPYWSTDANVLGWMKANNATFLKSSRNDNCQLSHLFGYGYVYGIHISANAYGTTQRMTGVNIDIDDATRGFWADSTAAGASAAFSNFNITAQTTTTAADLFKIEAAASHFDFANLRLTSSQTHSITVTSTTRLRVSTLWCEDWNIDNGGYEAISQTDAGGEIYITNPKFDGGSGADLVGGVGKVSLDMWLPYTPVVTADSGTITSYTINDASYRRVGTKVSFAVDVTITDNGTGAGGVLFTVPFANAGGAAVVSGRERVLTGLGVTGQLLNGASVVTSSVSATNAYPGGTGARLVYSGEYEAA